MERRLTEREVAAQLLKNLDLPYDGFLSPRSSSFVSLCLSLVDWDRIATMLSGRAPEFPGMMVDEIAQAWRELPSSVWTNDHWIDKVCLPFCKLAVDYEKLILPRVANG